MFRLAKNLIIEAVRKYPDVKPFLSKKALKAVGGYQQIRDDYFVVVYDSVQGYLESNLPTTRFRNSFSQAMVSAFTDASFLGYENAGGEPPLDPETSAWLSDRITMERGNIDSLFEKLFSLRREENFSIEDIISEANGRAEGYASTLDSVYHEAKMRGGRNLTLVFAGRPGKDGCLTCRNLEGKRHRISWIIENDMIPRKGNEKFLCGGWNCHHYWMNPLTGEEYVF